ncbi:MAG: hypothetical protein M1840_000145 [Geoglossum simile]|nr:MAG: hypothetical protein M1840_000145 [Geoglossum simile]
MSAKPNGSSQVIGNLSSASTTPSSHIENDHNNVDVRLRLLYKNNLIPKAPYILTVPCDIPYSRHPSQRHSWNVNSLFAIHEEQLQYVSFLYREVTDGVLRPIAGDTEDVMDKRRPPTNNTRSGTATPSNGRRIKMSLSDYVTNKPKAGMAVKAGQPLEANGSANGTAKGPPKETSSQPSPRRGDKRPADAVPTVNSNIPNAEAPSPAKKMRRSPSPRLKDEQPPAAKVAPLKVPPARVNLLPPLLSPTLPASIEAELARIEELELSAASKNLTHQKSNSTASSSSDNKNLSSSHTSSPNSTKSLPSEKRNQSSPTVPGKKPKKEPPRAETAVGKRPSNSETKTASGKRDVGTKATQREVGATKSSFFNYLRDPNSSASAPAIEVKSGRTETGKKKLIVKLKYGKGNKTRVQRLLNLNSKSQPKRVSEVKSSTKDRSKEDSRHDRDRQQDKEARGEKSQEGHDDQKSGKDSRGVNPKDSGKIRQKELPKPAEKRPRPEDEERAREPPAKKQKAPEVPSKVKIRTPTAPAFRSPATTSTGNIQRDQDATPKKQSQATASAPMHRVGSSEAHVRTPRAPPGSAEKASGSGRDMSMSASSDGKRTGDSSSNKDIDAWRNESSKYDNLGKDLKRQADTLFTNELNRKRAVVAAVESVLCYMISFAAQDNKSGERTVTWNSILPYCSFVNGRARPFPLIFGLSLQLSAVCHEMVLAGNMDRHSKSTPPDLADQDDRAKYIKLKTELARSLKAVKGMWSTGLSMLSASELQKNFPVTWAGQAKRYPEEMKEVPGKYGVPYRLPLTSCSSALEAVRVGHSVLMEWCKRENIDVTSKIVLE